MVDAAIGDTNFVLVGAPLLFTPTEKTFGLSVVLSSGDPSLLRARVSVSGTLGEWRAPSLRTQDLAEWTLAGLQPGTRYEYQVGGVMGAATTVLYTGSAVTKRPPGTPFVFALLSDSHIGADLTYQNQGDPETLRGVAAEIAAANPDFMIHLGDMLDFHQSGFNAPPANGAVTRAAYLNYRTCLADSVARAAHFPTVGNWEGENGDFAAEEIAWSREQRMLYVPGAGPSTYPESGSPYQDYYAFTWGDALFVVLNVMTYTTGTHLLGTYPGLPDDWTLGPAQLGWLEQTLQAAQAKWRFLFIHHAVGGKAGDDANSGYGRGGGQAAYVGEQAKVHQLMRDHGVQIFFYGHDHVFTDMVVDGIHYTEPGHAGAIWTFSTAETGYEQYWPKPGWAHVTVDAASVRVELIALGEGLLHEYTLVP